MAVNDCMGDYKPQNSINSTAAFQVSSIPFVTSSLTVPASASYLEITFPYITKFVTVLNTGSLTGEELKVAFSETGLDDGHNFVLADGESYSGDFRLAKIYLQSNTTGSASATVIAGMVTVPSLLYVNMYDAITGSCI